MSPHGGAVPPPPPSTWEHDLGLADLVHAFTRDPRYARFVQQTLAALQTDASVIAWRQAVLADFLSSAELVSGVKALLPRLADLRQGNALLGGRQRNLLLETSDRLAALELLIEVIDQLHNLLHNLPLASPALQTLRDQLAQLAAHESLETLRAELPTLRQPLQHIRSLTIGVNLDAQLQPLSAVLMAINDKPITDKSAFLERLIGTRTEDADESGIAPLHQLPHNPDERPLSPLFRDLDRLLSQIAQPVARALSRYVKLSAAPLAHLEYELAFFAAAVDLIKELQMRGVTFCAPQIAPAEARLIDIDGLVNLHLALRNVPAVPNAVQLGDDGRIAILTGPNSGGKTTYLHSVGLAQVFFQAGLFVPAQRARLSPVDALLTHFPALETRQQGRLAEEAARLREILARASAYSLVLLNETFSSTALGEALYLAQDILAALRAIGARTIYATHLVELVERIDEIERTVEGDCRVFSLVAGVQLDEDAQGVPTFQITRGQPLGRSYAQEIARRHGISLAQILQARKKPE